jgi:hypothetical protein
MEKDGKYIYCIVASEQDSYFGSIGIGEEENLVHTIGCDGLCMVVSDHPLSRFVVSPENILAHQKVLEKVMEEYNSVLPVKFGTIASTVDEIRNLLSKRAVEFKRLLGAFENKVEINIKGTWKNINMIFQEIDQEDLSVQEIRKQVNALEDEKRKKEKMVEAGLLVQKALENKKELEAEEIVHEFKRTIFEYKHNPINSDPMFMNTAFLLNKGRAKEFDFLMEDIALKSANRIDFKCTGPLPAFNFIDLQVFPEEWEV